LIAVVHIASGEVEYLLPEEMASVTESLWKDENTIVLSGLDHQNKAIYTTVTVK